MSSSAPITVYTTNACPYCSRAKALLQSRGLEFEEINLGRDPETRIELSQRTGMMTFPQVLVGETVVGGYDDLAEADRSGRLAELVGA